VGVRGSWTSLFSANSPFRRTGDQSPVAPALRPVPFLSDGELEIFESGAGLLHLARKNEKLMPRDPVGEGGNGSMDDRRAQHDRDGHRSLVVPRSIRREDNRLADWMGNRLDQLEKVLNEREWLAADRFTAADLLMADVLRIRKSALPVIDPRPIPM
jgi:glutathione S-transferase